MNNLIDRVKRMSLVMLLALATLVVIAGLGTVAQAAAMAPLANADATSPPAPPIIATAQEEAAAEELAGPTASVAEGASAKVAGAAPAKFDAWQGTLAAITAVQANDGTACHEVTTATCGDGCGMPHPSKQMPTAARSTEAGHQQMAAAVANKALASSPQVWAGEEDARRAAIAEGPAAI